MLLLHHNIKFIYIHLFCLHVSYNTNVSLYLQNHFEFVSKFIIPNCV